MIHALLSVLQFQLLLETGEKSWYSLVPKEQTFAANVQEQYMNSSRITTWNVWKPKKKKKARKHNTKRRHEIHCYPNGLYMYMGAVLYGFFQYATDRNQ